jgi:hypothetical protein
LRTYDLIAKLIHENFILGRGVKPRAISRHRNFLQGVVDNSSRSFVRLIGQRSAGTEGLGNLHTLHPAGGEEFKESRTTETSSSGPGMRIHSICLGTLLLSLDEQFFLEFQRYQLPA